MRGQPLLLVLSSALFPGLVPLQEREVLRRLARTDLDLGLEGT